MVPATLELKVTRRLLSIGLLFTGAFSRSTILPIDGNYRYYLNAGIIAMNMNAIAMGAGPWFAADRRARGNRR